MANGTWRPCSNEATCALEGGRFVCAACLSVAQADGLDWPVQRLVEQQPQQLAHPAPRAYKRRQPDEAEAERATTTLQELRFKIAQQLVRRNIPTRSPCTDRQLAAVLGKASHAHLTAVRVGSRPCSSRRLKVWSEAVDRWVERGAPWPPGES